ncbi:hypothetical protein LXL04_016385 [Taraxacum kok-saghyz]
MSPPPSIAHQPGEVCRLRKALYGLKQAPRAWFEKFSTVITSLGFRASNHDSALFVRCTSAGRIILSLYVDDMIITGDDHDGIESLKRDLAIRFAMKDLGLLRYFLGIEVAHSPKGYLLSQTKYISDLFERARLTDNRTTDTPIESNAKYSPTDGVPLSDPSLYRTIVGSLVYLTVIRPDIAHADHVVSQFVTAPSSVHWGAVLRILRYLRGTQFRTLAFPSTSSLELRVYSDANWDIDIYDRKSTAGYCVFLMDSLISWKSKKQDVVSRSSTKSEYRAMAIATCEVVWLRWLLADIWNSVFHERTKHIEIDCHFTRHHLQKGTISLPYVPSKLQIADSYETFDLSVAFLSIHGPTTTSLSLPKPLIFPFKVYKMVGAANGGARQIFSVVNGGRDPVVRVGPASSVGSDCGAIEFTKEDVESLLHEKIRTKNKFSLKEKCDSMMEYIKRLRLCIKWFQELEAELLLEQEKNGKMLESAKFKCNEIELLKIEKEEELNSVIMELRKNYTALQEKFAKEELDKLTAMETLTKEKEARLSAERSQASIKENLETAQRESSSANQKILSLNDMYKKLHDYNTSLQQYNCKLQTELNNTNEILKNVEKEKVGVVENLSNLRGHCTSLQDQLIATKENSNETMKQKEALANEVGCLRLELHQVREDRDRQLALVQDLSKEVTKYKELTGKSSAELDNLTKDLLSSQAICSSQNDQINKLQEKLTAAENKLKTSDLSTFEITMGYEEQKKVNSELQLRLAEAESKVIEGDILRKKLHNTILELKGNIRVFCRVRPLLCDDGDNETKTVSFPTTNEGLGPGIELAQNGKKYTFSFDKVFVPKTSQEEVFVEVSQLVQSALDGYKVCIFAYGQTGSGKTHTMMGTPGNVDEKGLIPRSLEQIFKSRGILQKQGWKYEMQVSMLEIYNETIRDLLSPNRGCSSESGKYVIKHDANGNTHVSDLTIVDVRSEREVSFLLNRAEQSRSVGKTQMNEQSSRSHFVFTLRIIGVNESTEQQVQGVLNLIDLAGSERLSKSGSTGDRLTETQAINKSLSSLSNVIFALARKEHVPFRDSKLTYLLQPCLGGDSKTLMVVNVSPAASSANEYHSNQPHFSIALSNSQILKPKKIPPLSINCNLSSPPKSKEEAIRQAKTCLSSTLEKPLNNPKLAAGKLKKLKQPRFRVEIPVIDDSPDSLSQLALQLFDEMPLKKKASKVKILILWPNSTLTAAANKAPFRSIDHIDISSLKDGGNRVLTSADVAVFLTPEASQMEAIETITNNLYPKPVVMFNPRWSYEDEENIHGEFINFLGSFEVIYSFMGLEVRGLLSKRNGVVFKCVRDGVLSGERWSVLVEEEGELKVVSRFKTRPSIGEVENVLYNLMAINSPMTKSAKFLKGLVSNSVRTKPDTREEHSLTMQRQCWILDERRKPSSKSLSQPPETPIRNKWRHPWDLQNKTSKMTNDGPSPVTKMQTLGNTGTSSQPMPTPLVHTVTQTKGAQVETTRVDSELEEYIAFKKYQQARKKHEEALKGKNVAEDDLDRVSVHTCPDGESDGEIQAIRIPEKKQTKHAGADVGPKKPDTPAMTKAALEAKKYHEAFEELDFRSPFTDDINETPVPQGLKGPRIRMYDGTGDPDDHVHNFQWAIKMIPMNPKLWSLYFAGTLDGSARYWLASLPPKSIRSFEELKRKFCNSFIQQRRYQQQAHAIFACKQREGESNKQYFKRFNKISQEMPTRNDPMIIAVFTYGLLEGELFRKLVGKEFYSAEEMIVKVNRFLRQETESAEKAKSEGKKASKQRQKRRFVRNPNQYCDFHKRTGHSTNDCEGLKKEREKNKTIPLLNLAPKKEENVYDTEILMVHSNADTGPRRKRRWESLSFDMNDPIPHNHQGTEPLIIQGIVGRVMVHRIYVDNGSSANIIYAHCLSRLPEEVQKFVRPATSSVVGFAGQSVWPEGKISLPFTLEDYTGKNRKTILAEFIIIKASSPYNMLLGRTGLCQLQAVPSTVHGLLKFPTSQGTITIKTTPSTQAERNNEVRTDSRDNSSAAEDKEITIHPSYPDQKVRIGANLPSYLQQGLETLLKQYVNIFAWIPEDLVGVSREMVEHHLNINPNHSPIVKKKRVMAKERNEIVNKEVEELVQAGILRSIQFPKWIANPVLVKKGDGSMRMCVDFTDLNKACPKDSYPLPEIEQKIEALGGYKWKSFLDAYKGYHQRLVDKAFEKQIGRNIEAYVDDMVIKSKDDQDLLQDVEETLRRLQQIDMKLNPKKCVFGTQQGKFLGHIVTEQGIQANPVKVKALMDLQTPKTMKDIQSLNGKMAALGRFLAKSAIKSIPFFKAVKQHTGKSKIEWTIEAESALQQLKQHLLTLPTAVLIAERDKKQVPVYFVSRVLQGSELNYSTIEKLTLSLIHAVRRLRRYFQAHPVSVLTNQPIRQIMMQPERSGRMTKWAIELGEYDIHYKPRTSIKGQALADFLTEIPSGEEQAPPLKGEVSHTHEEGIEHNWKLYTDGASSREGSGAWIVLLSPTGERTTYALRFNFKCSNNEAEYEALLAGLCLATSMKITKLCAFGDSLLVTNQVNGLYTAKEVHIQRYLAEVKSLVSDFQSFTIAQVPRSQNTEADALSKLASVVFSHLTKTVLVEILPQRSINETQQQALAVVATSNSWIEPYKKYLLQGTLPTCEQEARKIRINAVKYTLIGQDLYRKGYSTPWLRCLTPEEAQTVSTDIHTGLCGSHTGARAVTQKILRAGYFWPTMTADTANWVQKCQRCQIHSNLPVAPAGDLISITSPWPFFQWGIDIVGPFPMAPGKLKFLVVAIDYFSKWVEAEPLAVISGKNIVKFVWRQIVCRFGLPNVIISDNGKQFASNPFTGWCKKMNIQQKFSSVAHPQANGQVEVTNRTIVKGIKTRLGRAKGSWVDELQSVLWSYRTTVRTATQETPFSLVYGSEAIIPVELTIRTIKTKNQTPETNATDLRYNLDTLEERRNNSALRQAIYKTMTERYYNSRVRNRACRVGEWVLRKNEASRQEPLGKLSPNWEGPYQVVEARRNGPYVLATVSGKQLPRTWNMNNLRKFYF